MFREMRKIERKADESVIAELLMHGEYGVLSTIGEDNYAYGVPLSYAYIDKCIYFHCAKDGHKLDNISYNNKVCFTIVGATKVLPDKFSTEFESVIIFGKAAVIDDDELKRKALIGLLEKYSADYIDKGIEYINRSISATAIVKIDIEHIAGKRRS